MSLGLNRQVGQGSTSKTRSKGIASTYFPLREENEWDYQFEAKGDLRKEQVRVLGTERYRGVDWYHLTYSVQDESEVFRRLLRTEGDLLLQYNVSRTEEIVLIDFSREVVDRTDLSLGYVEEREKTVKIHGLSLENCLVVSTGHIESEVGLYAPGIGLVESSWMYGRKQLTRAFIDGMEVGN